MRIHFECYGCNIGIVANFDSWVTLEDLRKCPFCGTFNTEAEEFHTELPKSIQDLSDRFVPKGYYATRVKEVKHGEVKKDWVL